MINIPDVINFPDTALIYVTGGSNSDGLVVRHETSFVHVHATKIHGHGLFYKENKNSFIVYIAYMRCYSRPDVTSTDLLLTTIMAFSTNT